YSCVDATSAGGKPAFLREAPSPDPRSAKKRGPVTHIEVEAERITSSVLCLIQIRSTDLKYSRPNFGNCKHSSSPRLIGCRVKSKANGGHQDHNRDYCSLGACGSCGSKY